MRVLTYKSYKEHCELYTEIHDSIAINSYQIELGQKYIILLSEVSITGYKPGKRTSVEYKKFIHFNLLVGTYSIDDFNAKIKAAISQQRQDWEPPQIKDLSWSHQKTTHLWSPIIFLLRLAYPTTILKRLR